MKKRRMIILFSILAFVMVLVALNSFVFSIQEIRAECYNSLDTTLYDEVVQASGIQKNKNILTVNENKAIDNIHTQLQGKVHVVNIERKFPDKVWIHFYKLINVMAIQMPDGSYLTCDDKLNVIATSVSASDLAFNADTDAVDNYTEGSARPVVRVVISGSVAGSGAFSKLKLSDNDLMSALSIVADTINRLGYQEADFVRLLSEINISYYNDALNPRIILKMRESGAPGITIEVQNAKILLQDKIRHAISAYEEFLASRLTFSTTAWTVYHNSKNEIIVAG